MLLAFAYDVAVIVSSRTEDLESVSLPSFKGEVLFFLDLQENQRLHFSWPGNNNLLADISSSGLTT